VVDKDKRLLRDVLEIVSAEAEDGLLSDLIEPDEEAIEEQPFTARQGKQVYRFHASRGRKRFLVEAQGDNTLGELDAALREVFDLDPLDHLSEFSLVTGKRARQPFGPLDPMGEYPACQVRLAGLGLVAGARLEYVYDFGDNIKHALELEAIQEPEARTQYPRYKPLKDRGA
jgi:hypothetical protein